MLASESSRSAELAPTRLRRHEIGASAARCWRARARARGAAAAQGSGQRAPAPAPDQHARALLVALWQPVVQLEHLLAERYYRPIVTICRTSAGAESDRGAIMVKS